MSKPDLPSEFLAFLAAIKGKRSRVVVNHILDHGSITTEELETIYHYKHPPRAIRDVREQGVPIETFQVKDRQGRTIAAYRFGDPAHIQAHKAGGRRGTLRQIKTLLLREHGARCFICLRTFDEKDLQVDHRVPYEIAGDLTASQADMAYMLVCRPCNRTKSWTCEHCANQSLRDAQVCERCFWARPEHYEHIAMLPIRRVELVWTGEDVEIYNTLKQRADALTLTLSDYIQQRLNTELNASSTIDLPEQPQE